MARKCWHLCPVRIHSSETISHVRRWKDMRGRDFLDSISKVDGFLDIRCMSAEDVETVAEIETSIGMVSGGMRLENIGLFQCLHAAHVFVLFCDEGFHRPEQVTMRMVDTEGVIVGHDVPPGMMGDFSDRDDVFWLSEGFIIHSDRIGNKDVKLVIGCSELSVPGIPGDVRMRLFYPSMQSAEYLNARFGVSGEGISSAVLGVDGLDDGLDQFL